MFEKFQVSKVSNRISCFKSHLKVSNKQLPMMDLKSYKFQKFQIAPLFQVSSESFKKATPMTCLKSFKFQTYQIEYLVSSLIWKFQIISSCDGFEKLNMFQNLNTTSPFESHLKVSNKQHPMMCLKSFKFQKFQIAHLISSLIWKFQISNSHDMFEKFQVSNISNRIYCFKSHLKVSNKQLLWWVWKA